MSRITKTNNNHKYKTITYKQQLLINSFPDKIKQKYPLNSLIRCFSKSDINIHKNSSIEELQNIYINWRSYEAVKRKKLRMLSKYNKENNNSFINSIIKNNKHQYSFPYIFNEKKYEIMSLEYIINETLFILNEK